MIVDNSQGEIDNFLYNVRKEIKIKEKQLGILRKELLRKKEV